MVDARDGRRLAGFHTDALCGRTVRPRALAADPIPGEAGSNIQAGRMAAPFSAVR